MTLFNFFQLVKQLMFIPEEVFPKVPAKLNLNLLPEFEERKEEDLNPPPDYGKLNAEYEEEKREEVARLSRVSNRDKEIGTHYEMMHQRLMGN